MERKIKVLKNKKFTRDIIYVDNLKEYFDIMNIGDLGQYFCDYNDGYICDIITEIADNHVSLWNNELLDWAKDNYGYIEDAIKEFGFPEVNGQPNFIRCIMQGQFCANEQELYENLEDIIKNLICNYIKYDLKLDYITKKQAEEILQNIDFEDSNERIENIFEQINEILGNEKILI